MAFLILNFFEVTLTLYSPSKVTTSNPISIENPINIKNPNVNGAANKAMGGSLLGGRTSGGKSIIPIPIPIPMLPLGKLLRMKA